MSSVSQQALQVTYQPIERLKPHPRNSRIHSKTQVKRIAASLTAFGVVKPILTDSSLQVIAGHGVLEAAKVNGLTEVPTIQVDHLTPDQVRAYILADNKLAELASWDKAVLAVEFEHLLSLDGIFELTTTGFEIPEIDVILQEAASDAAAEDPEESPEAAPAVTRPGMLLQLGKHRLLCASALEQSSYEVLLAGKRASVVFIDPPYNVKIDGHATGKGRIKHREFAIASGELSEEQFVGFLTLALSLIAAASRPGSTHYICMDWRHMAALLAAGAKTYAALLNVCVWVKNNAGMGSFYRSGHELVFVYRHGAARHRNNVQLGQFGRNRTNVWTYPGGNSLGRQGEDRDLTAQHPTPKPVAMVADALLDCSARGEIVLDSFLGSGSTLIAAERTGRICYGLEIDPLYVDLAIRRWQRHTGGAAIDAETGKRFDELAAAATATVAPKNG
ncbi:MAG: hypothetical protein QOD26_3818 [Betaproteobacteria bacterium]|jgi:DNA modification methylase|nr:hypothetical protein [Betaproteobacteria bacterium]